MTKRSRSLAAADLSPPEQERLEGRHRDCRASVGARSRIPVRAAPPSHRSGIKGVIVVARATVSEHAVDQDFEQMQHLRPPEREALHLVGMAIRLRGPLYRD